MSVLKENANYTEITRKTRITWNCCNFPCYTCPKWYINGNRIHAYRKADSAAVYRV